MSEKSFFSPDEKDFANVLWDRILARSPGAFATYAEAYLRAARKLIETAARREFETDADAFPVFYLFRHYLELIFKFIILTKGRTLSILDGQQREEVKCTHNLTVLFEKVREICATSKWHISDAVCKHIDVLGTFDKSSQRFRYPVDRNGRPAFPENVRVGLKRVKLIIEEVGSEMERVIAEVEGEHDWALDTTQEFEHIRDGEIGDEG